MFGNTDTQVNTFQAVVGYDETDSYVLFLYPEGGLNFFGTRPKESYNVEIELPARVGFSRGEVTYLYFSRTEGPHYSVTSDEQSVKNLYQVGNTGIPGVWLFHTGSRYSFENIVPASIGGLLATVPPGGRGLSLDTTTPEYAEFEYSDNTFDPDNQEEDDYPLTGGDPEFQPAPAGGEHSESLQPASPDAPSSPSEDSGRQVSYGNEDVPLTSEPRYGSEPAQRQYAPPYSPEAVPEGGAQHSPEQHPQVPLEVVDVYPPPRNEPRLSPGGHVVSVDEDDVDFDTGAEQLSSWQYNTAVVLGSSQPALINNPHTPASIKLTADVKLEQSSFNVAGGGSTPEGGFSCQKPLGRNGNAFNSDWNG
ncbi:nidogen-2-like [Morone saxatilis]|uniref:nidogen-2-like n=1 Tax=Morone saxatilis TaxID=34816 RepID=UPI0015E22B1F|nr:nidogen-2-like [Morone saxatilis]